MSNVMAKKDYDLVEITRLLLDMRDNCLPKDGDTYDDPKRNEKYAALNAAIDLINNPSRLENVSGWINVKDKIPERFERVLYVSKHKRKVYVGSYRGSSKGGTPYFMCNNRMETAQWWMPVPEMPKEDE